MTQQTGGRETVNVHISHLASGMTLSTPIHIIRGNTSGPIVGISAVIHGDEIVGVQVLRELWSKLDVAQLSGEIWMLPLGNPLAFEALSRNTPLDMLDMNRQFPGSPDGWLSEQMAFHITEAFLKKIDYYIDIHAGGSFPIVDYVYLLNHEGLSRSFLSELLYKPAALYPATTAGVTIARGVPTCVLELGGGYPKQDEYVARGVANVQNMLRLCGSLAGEVETRPKQTLLHEIKVMRPRNGGLCYPAQPLPPGTRLKAGTRLAEIVSATSFQVLETMDTPFEDNVVVLSRSDVTRVNPGDYTFMIGNLATAEELQ